MPKVLKNIFTYIEEEDPITHKKKQVKDSLKLELENRLDPDTNIDLMFSGKFVEYQDRFTQTFGFANGEEQKTASDIITKITNYDNANQKYTIYEGWNNTLYIKNFYNNEESVYKLSPKLLGQIKEIVQWIYAQEKDMSYIIA